MEYDIKKDMFTTDEIFFEGCQEQAVDLDFNLPDYCPDIQKILKCQVYPQITSRGLSSNRLDVDGNAIVKVLYIDSDKKGIRFCEQSTPFSCSFNLNGTPDDPAILTDLKVEYINCRAVSPRRLDIHGAFSICSKVINRNQQEVISRIQSDDVQQKMMEIPVSNVIALAQQQFSVNEVLEVSSGKPPIESIVRTDVSLMLQDYKIVTNKLIIKGEAFIKILYISDMNTGQMETMEYSVPISQIIDVDGITDDCVCDIKLKILSKDIQVRSDTSGEDNLLSIDLKIVAVVKIYNKTQINPIADVYSTEYELEVSHKQMAFKNILDYINDNNVNKCVIELQSEGVSKVIDVWSEMASVNAKLKGNQIEFTGKLNICILALDKQEVPFYIEKVMDFEYYYDWSSKSENIICDADISVISVGFRITGSDGIEIKTELSLSVVVYEMRNISFVSEISAKEEIEKDKEDQVALTIYYAEPGESVWNIARTYNTSVDAIKKENDLTNDVLEERGMILIPM